MRSSSGGGGGGSGGSNGWRATATATAPLSSYEFDFGIGSGTRGTSLKDQKLNSSSSSSRSSQQPATSWSRQQHQQQAAPAPSQQQQPHRWMPSGSGTQPRPMAGDITGKSWVTSDAPATGSGVVGGIGAAKADMFSDLLGFSSGIKPRSSAPISVANLGSALPKGVPMKGAKAPPLADLGIGSEHERASSQQNVGMNFSSSVPAKPAAAPPPPPVVDEDPFGDFVGSSSSGTSSKQNGGLNNGAGGDPFAAFASDDLFAGAPATNTFSSAAAAAAAQDPFAAFASSSSAKRGSSPKLAVDPLEDLWRKIPAPKPPASSSSTSSAQAAAAGGGIGKDKSSDEWLSGLDDWELNAGPDEEGEAMTTELEGLPPPPAGVSASLARDKGADFQKQGQFADAIKWLTWAATLSDAGDDSMLASILSCRVLCYKEVGEYKKAVEDCCKVLEINSSDTEMLLQRAFLYESMEKYKLGVQDLREVMRRDPSNRLAGNTLSRLVKMVD